MKLAIYTRDKQVDGSFNDGTILEKKPIGFPQEGGKLMPYSNLFYWAHAWARKTSTIPEHPHKAFEILSFVLEGEIDHYDNKLKSWVKLHAGDIQIIRAGKGISHAEKLYQGTSIFQIWFDPNFFKTIQTDPSYNDYHSDIFPIIDKNGFVRKILKGRGSPLQMESEGVEIEEIKFKASDVMMDLSPESIHSFFVLSGSLSISGKKLLTEDFFIVSNTSQVVIRNAIGATLFLISTPLHLSYQTYAERYLSNEQSSA
ncbi:pirin family protein [Solitalea koreensis]|uniref:Pirin N-terminal domain-containing protein n=1 Tax=Solitalea koreensis TaxID=543615 RepID=A0A521BC24_9SPHI|nr:pirin family protein [Solitalea koreensis]SMO44626.1 hypothetical protein SAMN06265350_10280 [Solitalea koreensis]